MSDGSEDYYDILGVRVSASQEDISKAYKELVVRYHPDKHQGNDLEDLAREKLKKINEAYEVLSDPQKRALYNAQPGRTGVFRTANRAAGSFRRKSLLSKIITIGIVVACIPMLFRAFRSPSQAAMSGGLLFLLFIIPRILSAFRKK